MTRARRLMSGSAWLLGGQVIVFFAQFAYVALTSRVLSPSDFGAYAVSVAVVALIALITNGGIAQAAMRAEHLDRGMQNSLFTVALLFGGAGSAFLLLTANFWAALWGSSSSVVFLFYSGPLVFVAPVLSLMQGISRREGRFRLLAITTAVSTLTALLSTALLVSYTGDPVWLVLGPFVTQALNIVLIETARPGIILPGRLRRDLGVHLLFTTRVTAANALSYVSANFGKFVVSRLFGVSWLGFWNRAESVTTAPFQLLQNSLSQAIYPELRTMNAPGRRQADRYSDLLLMMGWITFPLGCLAAVLMPVGIPLLLGPRWDDAIPFACCLAVLAGFTPVASTLGAVLEVQGRFRYIYPVQAVQILFLAGSAYVAWRLGEPVLIGMAMVLAQVVRHAIQATICARKGSLNPRTLLMGYVQILLASILVAGLTVVFIWALENLFNPWALTAGIASLVARTVLLFMAATNSPPLRLLRKYSITARRGVH